MKRSIVKTIEADLSVTSTGLLRQAKADDQTAWQQLVTLYSRRMYRWCRRAGLQPADAGNVTQEALHAVARKLGDFRRDRPDDVGVTGQEKVSVNQRRCQGRMAMVQEAS